MEPQYPEHDKLHAVADTSQKIGEFVEWLSYVQDIHLCTPVKLSRTTERLCIAGIPITTLLADFFEIDLKALEAEKRAMLAELTARADQAVAVAREAVAAKDGDCVPA